MDIDLDTEVIPSNKCFNLNQNLYDNLKICCLPTTSTIVLWNKYQIFFYEMFNFEIPSKIFLTDFQIHELLVTNNYLMCIDCNKNVQVTVLKFKNTTQKQFKCAFNPLENNIRTFLLYNEELVLSLKNEYDTYFLCLHKINSNFQIVKKTILIMNEECIIDDKKDSILVKSQANEDILKIFNESTEINERVLENIDFIVISFDRYVIYGCLLDSKQEQDEMKQIKLYTCPSEVKNIEITTNKVIISLTIGTIVILDLKHINLPPKIIHLNTGIEKITTLNGNFIYTDGKTIWLTENTFSDNGITFKDFPIRHVKDFIVYKNHVLCTTYTKVIYIMSIDISNTNKNVTNSAKVLINNSQYLESIFNEIDKNNALIQDLNKEQNYILAVTLCNRQDVIHKSIQTQLYVYDYYQQITEEKELTFTEELSNYTKPDIYILLISISFNNTQQKVYNFLSNLAEDCHLHITLLASDKVVKTTTVKLEKNLSDKKFLIPLNLECVTAEFRANIKIVASIPSAFDESKKDLANLYREDILLNSEHFVRTDSKWNYVFLKQHKKGIDKLIHTVCESQYVTFKFSLNSKATKEWSLYIKLPENYVEIFESYTNVDNLSNPKYLFIKENLNKEEFIKAKSNMILKIGNEIVNLEIENDGFSNPVLKVMSANLMIAHNLRSYLSKVLYNGYIEYESGKEYINWNFYATTENIQKNIKNALTKSTDVEEILRLSEQFEKNIVGSLPL